jgi:hypothetical protein
MREIQTNNNKKTIRKALRDFRNLVLKVLQSPCVNVFVSWINWKVLVSLGAEEGG